MIEEGILEKIKSRGYWRINIRPTEYDANNIEPITECINIIEDSNVKLRGWDYPHVPSKDMVTKADHIEGSVDWEGYEEVWRFYQSGQFIHYISLREDWWNDREIFADASLKNVKPGSILWVSGAIFQLTEIFEFFRRLATKGIYQTGVEVKIGLGNTKNRILKVIEFDRGELFEEYKFHDDDLIRPAQLYSEQEILENSEELAMDMIKWFFHRFNWHHLPMEVIKSDQMKLLKKKR